ncbi:MAG: hypothetical protein JXB60_03435 [Candidatus Cloacimonetes bacterium]|nr:hypothetical protein [Candidatus Cloacimonadota bacterium]
MAEETDMSIKYNSLLVRIIIVIVFSAIFLGSYNLYLKQKSTAITDDMLLRQTTSFLIISAIKSSLGIIEGSTVGGEISGIIVSAESNLQVGDIVQAPYDLVDFIWKILLYGIVIITFIKILFVANLTDLGIYIYLLGLILYFLQLTMLKASILVHLAKKIIIIGLVISLFIPLTLLISYNITDLFTHNLEKDVSLQLKQVDNDWNSFRQQLSLKDLKKTSIVTVEFVNKLYKRMLSILVEYISILFIRFLLFPIITGLILYYLFKSVIKNLLFIGWKNEQFSSALQKNL